MRGKGRREGRGGGWRRERGCEAAVAGRLAGRDPTPGTSCSQTARGSLGSGSSGLAALEPRARGGVSVSAAVVRIRETERKTISYICFGVTVN